MNTGPTPRQNAARSHSAGCTRVVAACRLSCTRLAWFCLLLAAAGCNASGKAPPTLAPVTGTITMDGEPAAKVDVTFFSEAGGQVSGGTTDESGKYELRFSGRLMGAKIGPNTVRITTPPSPEVPGAPVWKEKIPSKYNSKSDLKADVKQGPNTIDFELTSKK